MYPTIWKPLLEKVLEVDAEVDEYENGPELVDAFTQQVELAKIVHAMITEVFENRDAQSSISAVVAAKAVASALERWLTKLPNNLYWNEHTRHALPVYTVHLQ